MGKGVFTISGRKAVLVLFILLVTAPGFAEKVKFVPPGKEEREKAVGSTENLSEDLKKTFDSGRDFRPIKRPRKGDWLARHEEKGQTFDEYVRFWPNRPDEIRKYIYLQPLGIFENHEKFLANLKEFISLYFHMEVKLLPILSVKKLKVRSRINSYTKKRQLNCGDILERLKGMVPKDAYCLLGITMQDIYPEQNWNYVFGWASFKQRAGVFSFIRFDPTFWGEKRKKNHKRIFFSRCCKLVSHETGHMFGMYHCIYYRCNMNGTNSVEETDRAPVHLCPVCLRKLHYIAEFDIIDRYKKLYFFYRRLGLLRDASWIRKRLTTLLGEEETKKFVSIQRETSKEQK